MFKKYIIYGLIFLGEFSKEAELMRHFTVKLAVNKALKLFNNKDDVSKCKNVTHRLYCFSDKIKFQGQEFYFHHFVSYLIHLSVI